MLRVTHTLPRCANLIALRSSPTAFTASSSATAALPAFSSSCLSPTASITTTFLRYKSTSRAAKCSNKAQKGPHQLMNRSFKGIFAGKRTRYGNMVSHSERKTRRSWKPNVHTKAFWSQVLGRELEIDVTAAAIRTFDKYGGLDRYLLRTPLHRLDHGYTRALRLTMELKLLNNPMLATVLNLQDVLERMQRPSEVKRIRREIIARQEWARGVNHWKHAILTQALPDGTPIQIPELTHEQREEQYQLVLDQQNAEYTRRMEARALGPSEAVRASTIDGISVPRKNVARKPYNERIAKAPRPKRATFNHPFTRPTRPYEAPSAATFTSSKAAKAQQS